MHISARRLASAAWGSVAFALVAGGCETFPPLPPLDWPPDPQVGAPSAPAEDDDLSSPEDATVEGAVQRRLRQARELDEGSFSVDVKAGVVTLGGVARGLPERDRAVSLASDVRGVRGVVDRVRVVPPARADEELAADIESALASAPELTSADLEVQVEDGVVTLAGRAPRRADARFALTLAGSVRGARGVVDRIVLPAVERPDDEELRVATREALAREPAFSDDVLDVQVDDGVAVLSGVVDSAAERSLAADVALEAGAEAVDLRGVSLGDFARGPPQPAGRITDDDLIEETVLARLRRDPRLDDGVVQVVADRGVVTLKGTVRTLAARRAAEQLAGQGAGVLGVENLIKVRPEGEISDAEISARVEEAVLRDPWLFDAELTVLVENGRVILAGELPSEYQRVRARELAAGVEGVRGVLDRLEVQSLTKMSDAELRAAVLEELFWNPNVDASTLSVEVAGGVVFLQGEARDLGAAASARESAFLAGARSVVNEIEVPTSPPDVRTVPVFDRDPLEGKPFTPDTPFDGG